MFDAPIPRKYSGWAWRRRTSSDDSIALEEDTAISIRNLTKIYKARKFSTKKDVTAVSGLNLDIPKTGIFVLLGSNG